MCASVHYDKQVVINDGPSINIVNSEPPGKIVQTNLAASVVSTPKPTITCCNLNSQKPSHQAIMGNQQGSEGGKTSQGSKKKEKKENSKSNALDTGGSLRKSKSPSVKSKSSPASPGKKLFRRKQQNIEKETPNEEPSVAGACGSEQTKQLQPAEVFTDALETVEDVVQTNLNTLHTCKPVCDSSSDNISFESVSCATPGTQRAKPALGISTGDRVDELGKSIERTIMERFSDESHNLLETKSLAVKPVSELTNISTDEQELQICTNKPHADERALKCDFKEGKDYPYATEDSGIFKGNAVIEEKTMERRITEHDASTTTEAMAIHRGEALITETLSVPNQKVKDSSETLALEESLSTMYPRETDQTGTESVKVLEDNIPKPEEDTSHNLFPSETSTCLKINATKSEEISSNTFESEDQNGADEPQQRTNSISHSSNETDPQTTAEIYKAVHCEDESSILSSLSMRRTPEEPEARVSPYLETTNTSKTHPLTCGSANRTSSRWPTTSQDFQENEEIFSDNLILIKSIAPPSDITNSGNFMQGVESGSPPEKDPVLNATAFKSQAAKEESSSGMEQIKIVPTSTESKGKPPGHLVDNSWKFSKYDDTQSSESSPSVNTPVEDTLTRLHISESDILTTSENSTENVEGVGSTEKGGIHSSLKSPPREKRDLLSSQSASVDETFLEPANRQATLAEKRQHRLTDPLVDTLLLLIKQTMESDNENKQADVQISPSITKDNESNIGEDKTVYSDKRLSREDVENLDRLTSQCSHEDESIGGMDDDTLTNEDLAEFERLKKQIPNAAVDTDNQTENDEDYSQQSEDRFDLSSGETTEDSVIERPIRKVPALASTQEEDISDGPTHFRVQSMESSEFRGKIPSNPSDPDKPSDVHETEPAMAKKRSLTEDEIRREIRRFMIPEIKEALPNGGPMKQMLNDLHDITPTSESYPSMDDRDSTNSAEQDNSSGLRSRTSITSSELDISEHRDDMSTDSMYADDEDDSSSEVLFCKTYTEPVRGTEVLVSCTVVNSALKEANNSSDEFWTENSAAEEAYQQVKFAAAAVDRHFTHARSQMQDIQHHLQALKYQMQDIEQQVVKPSHVPSTDEFCFEDPERRAITD